MLLHGAAHFRTGEFAMHSVAPDQAARFPALGSRNYALLWSSLIVSNTGTWMQNVASGWLILPLTDSPLWLGLQGLSFAQPMVVLPLVGGAIITFLLLLALSPYFLRRACAPALERPCRITL
jgi:hypothetical protein